MLKMLLFLILAVPAIVVLCAIVALLRWFLSLLVRLAGAALAGGIVAIVSGVTASYMDPALNSELIGLLAGGLTFLLVAWGLFREPPYAERRVYNVGEAIAEPEPPVRSPPPEPEGDAQVASAWELAGNLLPGEQLLDARKACARLLHVANRGGFDTDLYDGAVLVRRHVPELVAQTEALMHEAEPEERKELAAKLARSLQVVGAKAEAIADRHREGLRDQLEARHLRVRQDD